MSDEDPAREEFRDEVSWILEDNSNEVWMWLFKDDLHSTVEIRHRGFTCL